MPIKTLNRPPPASGDANAAGVSLDKILSRLPDSERTALRHRTGEVLLGLALKQALNERGIGSRRT